VNRMLTMDAYKSRLEEGLTFLEFSYLLIQSYDFFGTLSPFQLPAADWRQ